MITALHLPTKANLQTSKRWRHSPLMSIVTAVVLGHALVLAYLSQTPTEAPLPDMRPRVMQVSWKQNPVAAVAPMMAKHDSDSAEHSSSVDLPAEAIPEPRLTQEITDAPLEAALTPEAVLENPPADMLQANQALPSAAVPSTDDDYLPRALLSKAPRPSTTVIVPFPDQIREPGRYTTILALFIDEEGIVRRVRIEGPALPQALEDAATKTFLEAPFRPGERQGQAVKSLMKIEVVFDNTPITEQASAGRRTL